MSDVIEEIKAERERQISKEGWTPEHDDANNKFGQLGMAASCYAMLASEEIHQEISGSCTPAPRLWPFSKKWWKPKNPRRNLI